jgi:PPIC-type PPIASE domain
MNWRHLSAPSRLSLLSSLVLLLGGCRGEQQPVIPGSPASAAPESVRAELAVAPTASPEARAPALELPYPRAAWRLAPQAQLDDVVLWFSQILIRYAGARDEVSFNLAQWFSVPPPATRSREQALALAQQIAQLTAADPTRFAELARQNSEDLPRREEGGAMGGVQASQIAVWPQVLDALAALAPGQTSKVVETRYGFHVFLRSAPPPEQVLSGAHIIIGHDRAQWLGFFARKERPTRSREDALALARDVYARARSEPGRFAELVNEYSEHLDARDAGDFGAWSTREPIAYALRRKRLQELAVGEVGAPIETHLGFEIIQRSAPRARPQFRARVLLVSPPTLSTEAPSDGPSEGADLRERANALAQSFAREPARFAEPSVRAGVLQWQDGRGIAGLSALLAGLQPGQVASSALLSEFGPVIAQRLEPEPIVPKAFATELPAPEQPDVEHFLAGLEPDGSQSFLRALAERARDELGLTGTTAQRLRELHELRGQVDDTSLLDARLAAFHGILEGTQHLLEPNDYTRYRADLNRRVREQLLGAPADSLAEQGL